jgi:hypothetical protein
LSLVVAVPDHPWTRATRDAAAVRIAMTVAQAGVLEGRLVEITGEAKLDTDEPELLARVTSGRINADLTLGVDASALHPLKANEGICSPGVKLHGPGFVVTPAQANILGIQKRPDLKAHLRPYLNGRDLLQRSRSMMVIDLYGLSEAEVMESFPEVADHLLETVKKKRWNEKKQRWEGRDHQAERSSTADAKAYAVRWWEFGKPRPELRSALEGLSRYIATTETSKHRVFQFLDVSVLPDNMIIAVASDQAFHLGVLQSRIGVEWALSQGGTLESRPRYSKSRCFDPFPFPEATPSQCGLVAGIAERLDSTRRAALAESDQLTMTGLYNLVEAVRSRTLPQEQEQAAVRARARIVAKLHDDLDAAVAAAYGWPADLTPAEIVARLVALNVERAVEEAAGLVRWLRPDYQVPRFGKK